MIEPGIHSVDRWTYHADDLHERPTLSASIASLIANRSPRHAWATHPKLNPAFVREERKQFDIGTCVHALILEGKPFEQIARIVYCDDWRTKAARELRDEARAEGKIPLLEKDAIGVCAMLDAAREQLAGHEADPQPFTDGQPEQTLVWQEGDIWCRARLDWLRDDSTFVDDFKTTSASADPERWTRTLFTIGADIQTAFYLRGLTALGGGRAEMRYVVQETYPPYALSVIGLDPAVLTVAESKVDYAIRRWAECLARDEWPAYPTKIAFAELPAWEESRWTDKLWLEQEAA